MPWETTRGGDANIKRVEAAARKEDHWMAQSSSRYKKRKKK